MPKFILHFGMQRTGTTSIQRTLRSNEEELLRQGISYPKLFDTSNHVKIPWWLKSNKVEPKDLADEIIKKSADADVVIISAEDFCLLDDFSFVDHMKKIGEVEIHLYMKEQAAWLTSWYNQNIKWPWNKKFSDATPGFFVENVKDFWWLDYFNLYNKLNEIEGVKLVVKAVSKSSIQDTLVDFLDANNIDHSNMVLRREENSSLTYDQIHVLRCIDLFDCAPAARMKIIKEVQLLDFGDRVAEKNVFTEEQVASLREVYLASNKRLVNVYPGVADILKYENKTRSQKEIPDWRIYRKYVPRLFKNLLQK